MKERRFVPVTLASGAVLVLVFTLWGPWASAQDFPANQTSQERGSGTFAPESARWTGHAGRRRWDASGRSEYRSAHARSGPRGLRAAGGLQCRSRARWWLQKPPEPVDEMPPEQKPAGDHVAWIPGYWTWEASQNKFIWTSGIWRSVPAGVEWVPGYWSHVDSGSQFVSGFWRKTAEQEVTYMPQKPPDTLENGPVGARALG